MRARIAPVVVFAVALGVASCSSTKLVTKWQAPDLTSIRFSKVLALAIVPDVELRHVAEAELCRQMQVECKPAYMVVPEKMMGDPTKAKALVQRMGFDGAIVFRVVSATEKLSYVPPPYGPTFWGYYGYAVPRMYDPGYYRADKIVRVETAIYSMEGQGLLWVATTDTMNPKSVPELVDDVAGEIRKELLRAHLVPEPQQS